MKRFPIIVMASFLVWLSNSCANKPIVQQKTEDYLLECLKSPSSYKFISFDLVDEETLLNQIQDRISFFESSLEFDKSHLESTESWLNHVKSSRYSKDIIEEAEKDVEEALNRYNKQKGIIDFLNAQLNSKNENLNIVVARNYKLTYEAKNPFGVELRSNFYSRFNKNDELIAVKDSEDDSWTLLGDFFQIPEYYDRI